MSSIAAPTTSLHIRGLAVRADANISVMVRPGVLQNNDVVKSLEAQRLFQCLRRIGFTIEDAREFIDDATGFSVP
jgi:hypothetical protein